jgi:Trk-type K+ transport system membrane component
VWSVFFEVVSAYGNVGLSLGHPMNLTSLCGHFNVFSKLIICAMMIRGRHRGLPYALDRAITLPNERSEDNKTGYRDETELEAVKRQQSVGID